MGIVYHFSNKTILYLLGLAMLAFLAPQVFLQLIEVLKQILVALG